MKILFGGLTKAHDTLISFALSGLGYEAIPLPTPDNESLRLGKEYCNKGQCNPTYYTVGNLIKFLLSVKEENPEEEYVFVTAGACGPCRFGMYEMEYRKALKEAGFPRFRVFAFEQSKAFFESAQLAGIKLDREFFKSLIKAIVLGDLLNDIYYKTKPYEIQKGETDNWREESLFILGEALKERKGLRKALSRVREKLRSVKVNYLVPKPKVKITGEFFAQTTEGDANYRLASWLVEEGAEPVVEPVSTWIDYLIFKREIDTKERAFKDRLGALKTLAGLLALKLYLRAVYNAYRFLLGNKPDPLKSQKKLAKYAQPYYSPKLAGGEGHMEVGKHVYAKKHKLAHLVVSVKPFGCMPSTQSDGVQQKVSKDLGGSLFVSVETSGDAEANVKSRILMKLYEAKLLAREEFERAKKELNINEERIKSAKPVSADTRLPRRYTTTASNALLLLK
ncbi:MAG: hypothetical protein GXO04_00365 [Aquificae bacterium]|nr:hypothetical protein [Aquificota bacterium]